MTSELDLVLVPKSTSHHQSTPESCSTFSVHPLFKPYSPLLADDGEESRLSQAEQGLSRKYEQLPLQTSDSTIFFLEILQEAPHSQQAVPVFYAVVLLF